MNNWAVQVLGPHGMLGREVCNALAADMYKVCPYNGFIEGMGPYNLQAAIIINCAGVVKQADAPKHHMIQANAYAPQQIAHFCHKYGVRFIHVSTDCVFQGLGPHSEDDQPDAMGDYALSKYLGEVTDAPHLTIRTSFVGNGKRGLIAEMQRSSTMSASRNLWWTGHTAPTIARLLSLLVSRPDITGLLHVPAEEQSRYGLVRKLAHWMDWQGEIIDDDSFVADRRLVSTRWDELGLPTLPSFAEQLLALEKPC